MEQNEKITPVYDAHGKFSRWFDNFWYHNKWKVIIITFIVLTLVVCVTQLATREEADIYVMYAGPYKFGQTDMRGFENAFSAVIPDRNGDGLKNVTLVDEYIMSDEQIRGAVAEAEENGDSVTVNYEMFANNREAFDQQIRAGETVICLLDPWLYGDVKAANGFLTLEEVLGYTPQNAYDEYSIRIGDTEFGGYFTVLDGLDDDTLLCVRRMSTFSSLWSRQKTARYHEYCLEVFRGIFDFKAPVSE